MSFPSYPSYEPVSPPWSVDSSPLHYDTPRAPVMPCRPLPPVDTPYSSTSPHHGLLTPPPSPGRSIHPLLCANPTIVRYDFTAEPRTIRMSSSVRMSTFPTSQPAAYPTRSTIYIECEVSGVVVSIHNDKSSHGITCADLFMQLYAYFAQPLTPDEWRRVQEPQRSAMKAAFNQRSVRQRDNTMRRVDYLLGHNVFKCLTPQRGGRSSAPTWLLQTTT